MRKNIKATVIFLFLTSKASLVSSDPDHMPWDWPWMLIRCSRNSLCNCFLAVLCCVWNLQLLIAYDKTCQPFTWFLLSQMPRKLLMDRFHKAIWYTKPGLSAKWITLPVDKSLGPTDRQCSLFCWHLSPG